MRVYKFLLLSVGIIFIVSCQKNIGNTILNDTSLPDNTKNKINSISSNTYGTDFSQNIGGKSGYSNIYQKNEATIVIDETNVNNIESIIENAESSSIIFIDEDLAINITNTINAPDNISIVSNRGATKPDGTTSNGALINLAANNSILFEANQVKFSGLRLNGKNIQSSRGISGINIEVENCEIYNFGNEAIALWGRSNYIHHNYIHNNQDNGYGYGVGVYTDAYAKIKFNKFHDNRHHISGNGRERCGYEASFNHILESENEINTGFDMHNWSNTVDPPPGEEKTAGDLVIVHHNTFEKVNRAQISIRGIPSSGCFVYNNHFKNTSAQEESLIYQRNYIGNLFSFNNKYEYEQTNWSVIWKGIGESSKVDFGKGSLDKVHLTDFDGDQKTDFFKRIFVQEGSQYKKQWVISNYENPIPGDIPNTIPITETLSDLKYLNQSNVPLEQLFFGDYNGDGKTDVLRIAGGYFRILWNGRGSWETVNQSNVPIEQLKFGDFNGDGKTDVLRIAGGYFRILWSARGSWETINQSSVPIEQLKFGDFNGDGKTDVLRIAGGYFRVLWSARGSWETINQPNVPIDQLKLGDFDGDGKTDVLINTYSFIQ